MEELYPLKFVPILKERIWGGTKLKTELGKEISSDITGESWEISTVGNDISVVAEGAFKGKKLTELLETFPEEILGQIIYNQFGKQFPLLFKFIDAKEDLSIQVHPNDELAKKRHNSFGKTEMWYIMQADVNSRIIVGFKKKSTPEEYLHHLKNKSLTEILNEIDVKSGDSFYLEPGTIHAIGGGILLAEIQQTSDITYRVYDWDRMDADGKGRELHVEAALDAMNYDVTDTAHEYQKKANRASNIVSSPYFTTDYILLDESMEVQIKNSFIVYMCTEGWFSIMADEKCYSFLKGDTILIPASLADFTLAGEASLLQIQIS